MKDSDWTLVWDIVLQHPSLIWTTIVPALVAVGAFGWWLKSYFTGRALVKVRADLAGVRADLAGVRGENTTLKEQVKLHEGFRQWAEARARAAEGQVEELKATIATLEQQIAAGAPKEALAATTVKLFTSAERANTEIKAISATMNVTEQGDRADMTFHVEPSKRKD